MSFGIQVKNIYDETQIDGLYKNFQVIAYGTSLPTVPSPSGFGYLAPVYANFDTKSVVVMARNTVSVAYNTCGASSYFYPNNTMNIDTYNSLEYVILEPINAIPPVSNGNYGIEVYNPSSAIVFSSAQKNFIVDAAFTITSSGFGSYQDIVLPPVEFGRRYYQMLLRWGNQTDMEGYGVSYQEITATNLRVFIDAYTGMSVHFLTGYFQP